MKKLLLLVMGVVMLMSVNAMAQNVGAILLHTDPGATVTNWPEPQTRWSVVACKATIADVAGTSNQSQTRRVDPGSARPHGEYSTRAPARIRLGYRTSSGTEMFCW